MFQSHLPNSAGREFALSLAVTLALACSKAAPAPAESDVCAHCHSSPAAPLPFVDPMGVADPTASGAGAHSAHLGGGRIRAALSCADCHVVPTRPSDPGHADYGTGHAQVSFGPLARTNGLAPSWDTSTARCSATWCHGAGLQGGRASSPGWTEVGRLRCDSCHGAPPALPHPQSRACGSCHPGTVKPDGSIDLQGGLHINGVIDVAGLSCTSCHGSGANPAPPFGTHGETSTTDRAVGAHRSHLEAGPLAPALACLECHVVPASTGHSDGVVKLTFGPLATAGGARPQFDGATCSASYCHGNFSGGNAANAPQWARVDGTQATCGTCHPQQPGTGHHGKHRSEGIDCANCHTGYGATTVNTALHVNGRTDLDAATGWNAATRSCSNRCHGTETW